MKVTIKDIARDCGVGVATVSRAINNSGYVRQEVKEQILRYVENIGWHVSQAALQLKTGKTKTIAILVNDILHNYNAVVLDKLNRALRYQGYQVLLSVGNCSESLEYHAVNRAVDAVVIIGFAHELRDGLLKLRDNGVHAVVIGDSWDYSGPMIFPDHARGTYEAMRRCWELGHRKVAFFGMLGAKSNLTGIGDCHYRMLRDMVEGLVRAAAEFGLEFDPAVDVIGDYYGDTSHLQRHLAARDHTVYICHTPELLVHFYVACMRTGLKIPDDVSVFGIGELDAYRAFLPYPEHLVHNYAVVIEKVMEALFDPDKAVGEIMVPYLHVAGQSLAAPYNAAKQC